MANQGIEDDDDEDDLLPRTFGALHDRGGQRRCPRGSPPERAKNAPKCDKANIDGPLVQVFPSVPEAMLTGVC